MHLVRLFQILFGQPQTRFNYRQEIPEIVRNPPGHFPERREPLGGVRALLCRGSLPESYIKRPVEPIVLSTIGLKAVVIRMGDVWHDTVPG
jgi:hypothetical protein